MMQAPKTLAIVLIAALIAALFLAVAPASAASNEPGVHLTSMTIEPYCENFNVTVHYSTSFMTRIFSVLFGARIVQPGIVDQLSGFGEVKLVSIDTSGQVAKLQAINQTQLSGGYYFYDGNATFPWAIDTLEIKGNNLDRPIMANNTVSVPTFFYRS
ncbi:MAG TPA: hypothetical protein VGJ92_04620 [Methanocella sp.]|jgi:hypothetical protein